MPDQSITAQIAQRDRQRLADYRDNLDFYTGKQWPKPRTARDRRRLTFNYTKPIIHKATSSLLKGRTTTVTPLDDTDAARAAADQVETAIRQVHDQNALDLLDFDTELDAAVLGDGVYKVWWDDDTNVVRVSAPDPSGIFAWTWPDDPSRVWRVANQYTVDHEGAQLLLGTTPPTSRSTITITDVWTTDEFARYADDDVVSLDANPFGIIPFVIFPNIREPKQFWGTSDIPALRGPQQELNRALTQLSLIMEVSGNPIAVLENVTEAHDIAVEPGAVWELPKDAKAYLLDLLARGGAKLHLDYLDAIYRALYDMGETPRSAFGGLERNISGVALELDLDPLVKKVERKRRLRTEAYRARDTLILTILDIFTGTSFANHPHDIAWSSILPSDRDREVSNEVSMVGAGIHSRRHAADQLGAVDNPDAEFARWLEEQRQVGPTQREPPWPERPRRPG